MNEQVKHEGGGTAPEKKSRRWIWNIVFLLVAVLSIWAVASQNKGFSLRAFWASVTRAKPGWLAGAAGCMLGFIFFEACALRSACRTLDCPVTLRAGCLYAASDIYFSAITPSATGGQPACGYLMMRGGMSGMAATAVLLLNLATYSLAILFIGLVSLVLRPGVFLRFGAPSRVLIAVGFAVQLGLALLFLVLTSSERLLKRICAWGLRVMGKLRILRDKEKWQSKLRRAMEDYRRCAQLFGGERSLLLRSFGFNVLQRASQISVTMLVFLAMGGRPALALDVWAMQSYVVIGSNSVPVPGAMGVADYMMLDGLSAILPEPIAVDMELLSRSLSFYCCILLCALMVLFSYRKKKGWNQ
ncbi:MAG: flippase-like domain-containing protein [Oscillospiraceae bacterium]|nr:flippase-like domain-containing protein [Oscillospiraceae bacterium]